MGGVAGRRSSGGDGPDPGRGGALGAGASPGKSPLTGGLDRTLAQRTVQLQPKDDQGGKPAPRDTDPSAEVPDLQQGEVAAINAVLASDHEKVLALMLKALQRLDATQFSSDDLTEHKLHVGLSTTVSRTSQGKAFQAWLETYLDDFASKASKTRAKLTKAEVRKAIRAAAPPADQKDIMVRIGEGFFSSAPQLYSTVRHEFIHVQQIRKDYLGYLPHSVLPLHTADPDIGTENDLEVEPNLWEMENLAHTGLKAPADLNNLLSYAMSSYESSTGGTRTANSKRFTDDFKAVWKASIDAHLAAVDEQYTAFTTAGHVADAARVDQLTAGLKLLWDNKARYGNPWSAYEKTHKAAVDHLAEMTSSAKADAFTRLLDTVDQEVAAGYASDFTAVRRWDEVNDAWAALEARTKAAIKPRYDKLAPQLWEKVFDAVEAQIQKQIDRGEPDIAQSVMDDEMAALFRKPYATVKTADFAKRRDALRTGIAAARKGKK